MSADANREGFRILRGEPALFPMELLWRWSFGLGLLALVFFVYAHLRQAVILTDADQVALSGQDSFAFAASASNLIAEVMPVLLRALAQICGPAALLWIASAALGRRIITHIIVRRLAADYAITIAPNAPYWTSFAILKFARVLMSLILVIGYLAGGFLADMINGPNTNLLATAAVVFSSLAFASVAWSYVNWVLSVAPIFVVRDALGPLDAIVEAIAFIHRNRSRLAAIAIWNGTGRGVAATVITTAGIVTAGLRFALPGWALATLLALETLAYLLISDYFLLARLGAYASVAVRELTLPQAISALPDRSGTAPL
jgi:hypothetical protein